MNLLFNQSGDNKKKHKRYTFNAALALVGYILSPLSWWNDLFVNVPLAYVMAWPFSLLSERLFLPAFVLAYWLSNLLGFVLLHRGFVGLLNRPSAKVTLRRHIIVTILYTGVILIFVWLQWIPMPHELIQLIK